MSVLSLKRFKSSCVACGWVIRDGSQSMALEEEINGENSC